jgi:ribonuclease HII
MVAAAVILPSGEWPDGLRDSKTLSAGRRSALYDEILSLARDIRVVRVTPARIDREGLQVCNLYALKEAVRRLDPPPDFVLSDGFPVDHGAVPHLAVVKGDRVAAAVAAAGIVAKVVRDRSMERYHRRYPDYGFARHKGYGTAQHRAALEKLGPSPLHRRSFAGVGDTVDV